MKTVTLNRFDGGVATSPYMGGVDQFSIAKHFDIHTIPGRLIPLRGVEADTSGQALIGNLLIGTDGVVYGLGAYSANNSFPSVYKKTSPTSTWSEILVSVGSSVINYDAFVEYHTSSGARRLFYQCGNNVNIIDPADSVTLVQHALSATNVAKPYVHPKDDILYWPYDNKIAANNNGSWTDSALTIPARYRITSICGFGNYLAIGATLTNISAAGSGLSSSVVYLWDRDATVTTVTESIDWGVGVLQVLNNLDGVLISISDSGGASTTVQDMDSVQIKGYSGGAPFLIAEIPTIKQTTTDPDVSIETRVNFIYRGRMYFSVNIDGGGASPEYRGLWCISRSKVSGQYSVNLERMATNDGSETGVIAAAILGDFVFIVHTNPGTLTRTIDNNSISIGYVATSIYESLVNPGMDKGDYFKKKKLMSVTAHYIPLPSSGQVVLKYRVDGGSWTTIATETTDGAIVTERIKANNTEFTDGRQYEFRFESTGFAEILGFTYKYAVTETAI